MLRVRPRVWALLLVLLGLAGGVGYGVGLHVSQDPRARAAYRAYDPARDTWLAEFLAAYALAEQRGDIWIQDPLAVGLRGAGYPNPDQIPPAQVRVWYPQANQVTMIVTQESLGDDSVAAEELRIDLERAGNRWRIAWLGSRARCVRDLTIGWTTNRCS